MYTNTDTLNYFVCISDTAAFSVECPHSLGRGTVLVQCTLQSQQLTQEHLVTEEDRLL